MSAQTITLDRDIRDRGYIRATVTIDRGYFSLTGELYEARGNGHSGRSRFNQGFDIDAGGQITEDILKAFPHLAPFARLHLSDAETGEPMHAEANGYYFASGGAEAYEREHYGAEYVERHGTGMERARRLLRVDTIPAEALTSQEAFSAFVDSLRPRWAEEAAEGRRLLAELAE